MQNLKLKLYIVYWDIWNYIVRKNNIIDYESKKYVKSEEGKGNCDIYFSSIEKTILFKILKEIIVITIGAYAKYVFEEFAYVLHDSHIEDMDRLLLFHTLFLNVSRAMVFHCNVFDNVGIRNLKKALFHVLNPGKILLIILQKNYLVSQCLHKYCHQNCWTCEYIGQQLYTRFLLLIKCELDNSHFLLQVVFFSLACNSLLDFVFGANNQKMFNLQSTSVSLSKFVLSKFKSVKFLLIGSVICPFTDAPANQIFSTVKSGNFHWFMTENIFHCQISEFALK